MSEYDFYLKNDLTRFSGEWVAIFGEKVVGHNKSFKEVAEMTDREFPGKKVLIARVPEPIAQLL
ncbi:MAG: DUF5678 domain-containing protein [Candidatus Micrarchaeota archaeon]